MAERAGWCGGGRREAGKPDTRAMGVTLRSLDCIFREKFQVGGASLLDLLFRKTLQRRVDSRGLKWRGGDSLGRCGAEQA